MPTLLSAFHEEILIVNEANPSTHMNHMYKSPTCLIDSPEGCVWSFALGCIVPAALAHLHPSGLLQSDFQKIQLRFVLWYQEVYRC